MTESANIRQHPLPPGRGSTVLTLGILSIALGGCFPAGLILGWLAISKARVDLPRIEQGLIREDEMGLTKAGKICGTVGICISGFALLIFMLQVTIFIVMVVFSAGSTP